VIISYSAFSGEINALSGAAYRTNIQIITTVNVAGKVTFYAKGKVIPGCNKISTVSSTSITATCNWKPSQRGAVAISARLYPTSSPSQSSLVQSNSVFVSNRSGSR
jgi:hypothetical protein